MTYDQAISYIHGVSNFFCKPGLDRIKELCSGLGDPQNTLKFIHVGGTNGKGSVCCMLDSVLRAEGYKVGLYTSPYITRFNERIRVNGESIPDSTLARLTERVKAVADRMADKPTEFELITAIAFEYFKEEGCHVVVLEVGMGGRLDATNIIDRPLLSIITGIALDHTAFLGDSIEKIAVEKAGIIKENSVALYGGEDQAAEAVIAETAAKMQSILYNTDYSELKITNFNLNGSSFNYRSRQAIHISMLGGYQPRNAAIVLDALDLLTKAGLSVSEEAIRRGISEAKWPARFEIIQSKPTVIFDGAHNPQGIAAAVESVKSYFGEKRVVVLTGVLRDKDYTAIARSISEIALCAFTITPDNPRALSADKYAHILEERGVSALPCYSINEAVSLAINTAGENDTALLCLGSLYTYGEIIEAIEKRR